MAPLVKQSPMDFLPSLYCLRLASRCLSHLMTQRWPSTTVLNKVRFLNPVLSGSKVRDRIVLTNIEERPGNRLLMTATHNFELEGDNKGLACVAEALSMFFF